MNTIPLLVQATAPSGGTAARRIKVYGGPVQRLYRTLIKVPNGPNQARVLRELSQQLSASGLDYHPRTLKRQLLGNIRYVPEILETTLLHWLKASYPGSYRALSTQFEKDRSKLAESTDENFYVSPTLFIQMADAFLLLHKDLSRRQLAVKLAEDLKKKDFNIGLETLQSALSGKTLKIRRLIEQQMLEYFFQEGIKSKEEILETVGKLSAEGVSEIQKVDVGAIQPRVDAYLLSRGELSKRRLAIELRHRLEEKGYRYHLSSLQSVLEGKTKRTRRVILETLQQLFETPVPSAESGVFPAPDSAGLHLNHYVSADEVLVLVGRILEKHPGITRRQLAVLLQKELGAQNFHFSLNTLQYILGGKTRRTRKAVLVSLNKLLQHDSLESSIRRNRKPSSAAWLRAVEARVAESLSLLQSAKPAERETARIAFFQARSELIRERWLLLQRAASLAVAPKRRGRPSRWEENPEESYERSAEDGEAAWQASDPFDRLVS